ncbi:MAG: rRNA maturation RNase YbeY [Clostridia bacterium]|nr:rRNA maturation RNase YbeY [Oscillospiraceae bacterium]MBR4893550.1 rRNA maturation RNase YbeY [Clostridia bacterium]
MNYIDLSIGEGVSFKKEQEDIIYDIVNKVCDEEKLPFDIYLSVIVVSKEEIRKINLEQRNIDKPTDVLSFPSLNFSKDYKLLDKIDKKDLDPQYNAVFLGDMVICYDKIIEQAEEYGHSKERELSYLTVHSMYHLLGYDHEDLQMKKDMRLKEEKILSL